MDRKVGERGRKRGRGSRGKIASLMQDFLQTRVDLRNFVLEIVV